MLAYQVEDMTCGHCAGVITRAVQAVDADARVEVDLGRHLVRVDARSASNDTILQAIQAAGYGAIPIPASGASPDQRSAGACCRGSGMSGCST